MKRKKKTNSALQSVTVLKIKLTLSDEQKEDLAQMGRYCRLGKNAGAVDWLMRQHGKPESPQQSQRLKKDAARQDKPKSESAKIYHAIRLASPPLTGTVHSMLANQVATNLSAKLDWRKGTAEDGKRPRRRDAILALDERPPFFTKVNIPVRASEANLTMGDEPTISFRAWLAGPTSLRIKTASLSAGQKRILHRLAAGEMKLADSQIVERDDEWYWHVPCAFERPAIHSDREAELWPTLPESDPAKQLDRPFRLNLPDRNRPWGIGDGWYLLAQTKRILQLKKVLAWRYRNDMGKGHGRKKIDAKQKQCSQHLSSIVAEVRARAIADIVRQCEMAGCGKLIYHEPSLPLREKCWFAKHGLDWDWTKFEANLTNALARQGVALSVVMLKKDASDDKGVT